MEPYLPKCFGRDSYSQKLRTEVIAIRLLTETVLSEIDKKNKVNESLKAKVNHNSDLLWSSFTWTDKLEELYSRMATFLQTLSLFICATTDTKQRLPIQRLISSPKVCSLPTVCRMLWRQVETVCRENDNKNMTRTQSSTAARVDITMASKSNQTVNSCLRYCESCQLSTSLIKMLVNSIIEQQKRYCVGKTHVSEFKRLVANEVTEMSQWGAMSGWVKAIQKDITWASEMVALSQTQSLKLRRTMSRMKEEGKSVEKNLKNDLQLVQTQLAAEKAQNSYLRHQIEDLNLSLKRRTEYEQSLQERLNKHSKTLQMILKYTNKFKNQIDVTKSVHKSVEDFVKTTLSAELRTINNLKENTKKTLQQMIDISYDSFNKQAVLKAELEEQHVFIDTLQKKCENFERETIIKNEHLKKLETMVEEKMQEENIAKILQRKVEELEISLEESKAQELLYKSKIETTNLSQIKVTGDPVRDMETQRQLNKRQMKRLLKENADLKTTLLKLKSLKTKCTTTLQ